jgi:hypothetical protein
MGFWQMADMSHMVGISVEYIGVGKRVYFMEWMMDLGLERNP